MTAKFILSKNVLRGQVDKLKDLGLKVSYSYKTNRVVGKVLQDMDLGVDFSIHAFEEIEDISKKEKIWFFTQAESCSGLERLLDIGIVNYVVDNEIDLDRLLKVVDGRGAKINLSLRMKFQEHRIGTGKYFVYGMDSRKVNDLIRGLKDNTLVGKLGVHIHRKSQNTSEWEIKEELVDSLDEDVLERIDFVNLGGGLPSVYRSSSVDVFDYIFGKIKETVDWLNDCRIEVYIEPGRFLAAPCVKLKCEVIQIQGNNLVVDTTIYNCALDNILTGTKMMVEGEMGVAVSNGGEGNQGSEVFSGSDGGRNYLIKGNSPTRDDIFRYRVRLKEIKVGDKIVFLNAGAYNYSTDFFGYKKLETVFVK